MSDAPANAMACTRERRRRTLPLRTAQISHIFFARAPVPLAPRNYTRETGLRRARENHTGLTIRGGQHAMRIPFGTVSVPVVVRRARRVARDREPGCHAGVGRARTKRLRADPRRPGPLLRARRERQAPALLARPDALEHSEPLDRRAEGDDHRPTGRPAAIPTRSYSSGEGSPDSGGFIRPRRRATDPAGRYSITVRVDGNRWWYLTSRGFGAGPSISGCRR